MARAVKTSKIRKQRIKEKEKELKRGFKKSGLSRREARRTAKATAGDVYEAERQQKITEGKAKSQARASAAAEKKQKQQAADAKFKADKQKAEQARLKGNPENRVTVDGKTYRDQSAADFAKQRESRKKSDERTQRGLTNQEARRNVEVGEVYERIQPDGTTKKFRKLDQSKVRQQKNTSQKPSPSKSEFGKTFAEERKKQGAGGEFAFKGKKYTTNLKEEEESKMAKHGGALAIMIAPVKSKKMKAIKKGAHGAKVKKAMYGAKMKKAKLGGFMKKAAGALAGGVPGMLMKKMQDGGSLKEVPSDNKGLGKLPKKVRNKMGYMKNGGKVTGPDKKKKSVVTVDQDLKDLGNALKEGVKMITIPGYGAMKLADYLRKRKQGMNKTEIAKAMSSAGRAGAAESTKEMGKKDSKGLAMTKAKRMVQKGKLMKATKKPTMKRTMTKLVKSKDKKISLPKKTVSKIDAPKEIKLKGRKMMYGGSMKKAMYGAKMKKKAMYGAKMKK